ncbi:lysozyme [uncultured Duncaniella sp.]|uniref:glycoside hydrolase family protein n=1 Tax=uncultured Duncaniella sp. TaxID=2768039 RepID=UPI0025B6467B|nr:lysozyme [uncultured Duncaniella sp.]
MRKILIFLMAIVAFTATSPAFAAKKSIMELPPYERAVLIIKHHETLHDSRRHWPYLGYGHRKLPGEKYFRGYKMSEREADALLRKDLNKFIGIFNDLEPRDALLLGVLSYNIGPGAVKKSSVYRKLKAGDRNIFKAYTAHCRYKGKFHKQLHQRRIMEFMVLFQK